MSAFIPPCHWLRADGGQLIGEHATQPVPREFARIDAGRNGLIRNVSAEGCGDCAPPHLPTGIKFQGDACGWSVVNAQMRGFRMAFAPGRYTNGDGFASELGNRGLTFNTCKAIGNADAGFDLKGPNWRLHNCLASENAHNFRCWSGGHATGKLISQTPKLPDPSVAGLPLHLHVCIVAEHAERQEIVIDTLYARGPGVLLRVETKGAVPPRIVIKAHDIKGVSRLVIASGPAPEIVWQSGEPS